MRQLVTPLAQGACTDRGQFKFIALTDTGLANDWVSSSMGSRRLLSIA